MPDLTEWSRIVGTDWGSVQKHGFFVVKDNPDTDLDIATARQKELIFFRQHPQNTKLNG